MELLEVDGIEFIGEERRQSRMMKMKDKIFK